MICDYIVNDTISQHALSAIFIMNRHLLNLLAGSVIPKVGLFTWYATANTHPERKHFTYENCEKPGARWYSTGIALPSYIGSHIYASFISILLLSTHIYCYCDSRLVCSTHKARSACSGSSGLVCKRLLSSRGCVFQHGVDGTEIECVFRNEDDAR